MSVSFINESCLEKKTRIISSRKRFHKNIEFFLEKEKLDLPVYLKFIQILI